MGKKLLQLKTKRLMILPMSDKELENLILYEYDRKLMEWERNDSSEADSVKQQLEDPDKE